MNANEIIIPCRLSYSHIWEPASVNGSDPKYSVCCLIPKTDTRTLTRINKLIEQVKQDGVSRWGGKLPKKLKLPLRDGDAERDDENYAGQMFLNANSGLQPKVIDAHRNEVMIGCFACGRAGRRGTSRAEAIEAWNAAVAGKDNFKYTMGAPEA